VTVSVQSDFVSGVPDHGAFFGEGFERVAGDEESCGDGVFGEELEETADADCAAGRGSGTGEGREEELVLGWS